MVGSVSGDMEYDELIAVAKKDGIAFTKYVKKQEEKVGFKFDSDALLSGIAYSYLERKYTKAMYNLIGEHIWEWMD